MTVCIAASCERGTKVVCATDGMLSHIVSADLWASKMIFLGDWLFMFAGQLSNADLMMDELRPLEFSAGNIRALIRSAFAKRFAQWSADRFLLQYDLSMQEFKKEGRQIFGDERFSEISRSIEQDASNYNEQVIVVGYGKTKHAANILGLSRDGLSSHALDGITAIGSGADVAMSTLMTLGQNRHSSLEETLYSVSAAKFAAEHCEGVGKSTWMHVVWKRRQDDPSNEPPGNGVQPDQIHELRRIWEKYGRPSIPQQGWRSYVDIANSVCRNKREDVGIQQMIKAMTLRSRVKPSASRKSKSGQ